MATKINVRSPYFIKVSDSNLDSATMRLYIWYLSLSNPEGLRYTLVKQAATGENSVVFEISELVRDYLDVDVRSYAGITTTDSVLSSYITRISSDSGTYEGSDCLSTITQALSTASVTQSVWVRAEIDLIDSSGTIFDTQTLSYNAVDGYTNWEDGINAELSRTLLQSNKTIYVPTGEDVRIPVYSDFVRQVKFYYNGSLVDTVSMTSSDFAKDQIIYATTSFTVDTAEVIAFPSGSPVVQATLNIYYLDECKYTPHKITFVNKFGALQDIWFFKRSNESMTTTAQKYKANVLDLNLLEYSVQQHQHKQFFKQGTESIVLNTGYIVEDFNSAIEQLLLSEQVWITKTIDGSETVLPVNPKTETIQYKTRVNDKLINYVMEFEYAFDKVNNIK